MISYYGLKISGSDDYQQLTHLLDSEFGPEEIGKNLQSQITNAVKFVLIEYDYVDKDYRSTFYNYYSKMGRWYRDDCVRLHFFDDCVRFDEELMDLTCSDGQLKDHYFGFIVLRPTTAATLGRSILSPDIRVGASGMAIQSRHRVHLLGHTLSVWGFPSMAQHADISVCAHVSCWAILRHYSERFSSHKEILLHDVTRLAATTDPGGITPSLGLDIYEAERILQAAGCFPVLVSKKGANDLHFFAQLLSYLESGFPLFVSMGGCQHAIVVTGYAWRDTIKKSSSSSSHVWSQVETLLVVDDNLLPYRTVGLGGVAGSNAKIYSTKDFDAFIAPLPEKIYYPANAVEKLSLGGLYSFLIKSFGLPDGQNLIRRYFITTISAFRRFARENQSQMGNELVGLLMNLATAQFIWVVEYSSYSQWSKGHITARAIIDASASPMDDQPVWLIHNDQEAIVFDRVSAGADGKGIELMRSTNSPLARMERNLRPVKSNHEPS